MASGPQMSANKYQLHNMIPIEEGKTVADYLPVFADVRHEIHFGVNKECASCRKPFNAVRKPRRSLKMYPMPAIIPFCFQFDLCGACYALHQAGGAAKDSMLAAVEAYADGVEEAMQ